MNFFKLYIGDYQRDTAHLSVTEHGAYLLMLQHYYATEKPLPTGKALHRMLRAQEKAERDAIDCIAAKFWTTTGAGLVNERADAEICKAATQADTNRGIAQAREAARKAARERHEQSTNRATNDQPNHSQTPEIPPIAPQGGQDRPDIPCPYAQIVSLYHEHLPSLPRAKLMPPARQRAMRKAWGWVLSSTTSDGKRRASTADEALHWLAGYFARANDNDFLMGRTPRSAEHKDWRCDIDFLLTDRGMRHVIERTQDAA